MKKPVFEVEIYKLDGKPLEVFGDAQVYQVVDPTVSEGVFYLIISQEKGLLQLTSIDLEGTPNQVDMALVAARCDEPVDEDESNESILTWKTHNFEGILTSLLGNHAAIILKDLDDSMPVDEIDESSTSLFSGGYDNVIKKMTFDFDPNLNDLDLLGGGSDEDPTLPPSIDPTSGDGPTINGDIDVSGDESPDAAEPDDKEPAPARRIASTAASTIKGRNAPRET